MPHSPAPTVPAAPVQITDLGGVENVTYTAISISDCRDNADREAYITLLAQFPAPSPDACICMGKVVARYA